MSTKTLLCPKRPSLLYCYLLLLVFCAPSVQAQESATINWLTFEEALALQQEVPKKMMVYVYFSECIDCGKIIEGAVGKIYDGQGNLIGEHQLTVSKACPFCEQMEKKTWNSPQLIEMANRHFYMVALDASSRDTMRINNKDFYSRPLPKKGEKQLLSRVHTLSEALTNSIGSYPNMVFLNEQIKTIKMAPGFRSDQAMLKLFDEVLCEKYPENGANADREMALDYFFGTKGIDEQKAHDLFVKSYTTNPNNFYTQMWLAYFFRKGLCQFPKDLEKAKKLAALSMPRLKNALGRDQGEAFTLWGLANWYHMGVSGDNSLAAMSLKAAAKQRYLPAVYLYALACDQVDYIYSDALAYYRIASEQNMALASEKIGDLYTAGKGVKVDNNQARIWYQKACEQGAPNACKK